MKEIERISKLEKSPTTDGMLTYRLSKIQGGRGLTRIVGPYNFFHPKQKRRADNMPRLISYGRVRYQLQFESIVWVVSIKFTTFSTQFFFPIFQKSLPPPHPKSLNAYIPLLTLSSFLTFPSACHFFNFFDNLHHLWQSSTSSLLSFPSPSPLFFSLFHFNNPRPPISILPFGNSFSSFLLPFFLNHYHLPPILSDLSFSFLSFFFSPSPCFLSFFPIFSLFSLYHIQEPPLFTHFLLFFPFLFSLIFYFYFFFSFSTNVSARFYSRKIPAKISAAYLQEFWRHKN